MKFIRFFDFFTGACSNVPLFGLTSLRGMKQSRKNDRNYTKSTMPKKILPGVEAGILFF